MPGSYPKVQTQPLVHFLHHLHEFNICCHALARITAFAYSHVMYKHPVLLWGMAVLVNWQLHFPSILSCSRLWVSQPPSLSHSPPDASGCKLQDSAWDIYGFHVQLPGNMPALTGIIRSIPNIFSGPGLFWLNLNEIAKIADYCSQQDEHLKSTTRMSLTASWNGTVHLNVWRTTYHKTASQYFHNETKHQKHNKSAIHRAKTKHRTMLNAIWENFKVDLHSVRGIGKHTMQRTTQDARYLIQNFKWRKRWLLINTYCQKLLPCLD